MFKAPVNDITEKLVSVLTIGKERFMKVFNTEVPKYSNLP